MRDSISYISVGCEEYKLQNKNDNSKVIGEHKHIRLLYIVIINILYISFYVHIYKT